MISIHALREEGDRCRSTLSSYACIFLSTPSARRATKERRILSVQTEISIHALREEGDPRQRERRTRQFYFYPRPPRGGRQRVKGA